MGEINEALGNGRKFKIAGKEYDVVPATIGEIEDLAEAYGKTRNTVVGNFLANDNGDAKEALYKVLEAAFGGKVKRETLKKLRRDEVQEIIEFFLVG